MSNELQSFVKESLEKNVPRARIQDVLKKAGWKPDEVRNALDAYADADFPVPVPRRKPYMSAREAFMYLVMFLTLYWTSFSFGQLIYQFINRAYPDPLQYGYIDSSFQTIRMDTASIIIAFPVFLYVSWVLGKAMKKDPEKRASKIRKWLTYLTLFIAAGIIIGDLIALVFNALGGELTPRFLLKVLTVGAIAGSIFGFYLIELRKEEKDA
ncbi:hypothetical protein A3E39_04640 [Candidatus Uhrbacteria bacterium RIFCSPHIGHO2_12_FULL_60_25]|uniref:DUF5671 domain-containing protein n=1 Tax=Candidatus Uhrbacteria bacterium RIFCSPHIGHO2_12_FULL_60_25 TaxID=1802399 RepID=A0A1F7UJ75_9BACT|nr:MAG: hypothetical protein A3D73_03985 [Candidatus Uhrbacteria bacterium RIFCSPHIGHO2_02_FULL_60_44]OGL78323.1 MAG: hypothetical protein A3E39_04640 [Candidatus Uhrbacteria bacterium RIFCSPHIGHO2_12_FULL_60_25]